VANPSQDPKSCFSLHESIFKAFSASRECHVICICRLSENIINFLNIKAQIIRKYFITNYTGTNRDLHFTSSSLSVLPSVYPFYVPKRWILWNFMFQHFSKPVKKIHVWLKSDKNNGKGGGGTLCEDLNSCTIIAHWILLRMKNVSQKCCRQNQNTHFMLNSFFRKSCHLWHKAEKYVKNQRHTSLQAAGRENTILHVG
jgi:hypothetical protein